MRAVGIFKTADQAFEGIDTLSRADIYAVISGCQATGYGIQVRDSQEQAALEALRSANVKDGAKELSPEVTK